MTAITVMEYERGLEYRGGVFLRVLEPGRHRSWRWTTGFVRVDLRERLSVVAGQEMLTSDGVTVRASVLVRWKVVDVRAFSHVAQSTYDVLHAATQLALRDAVTSKTADALFALDRGALTRQLTESVAVRDTELGTEVLAVELRDLTLPAEIRRVFAEVALARQQGLAALERARGETAALRAMANGASVLDSHPALAALRTAQLAAEAGGKVVIEVVAPPRA